MRLLVILSAVWIANAGVIKEEQKCDGLVFNDIEILKSDIDRPFLLATDYSRNILYFSYSTSLEDVAFKTASINLNTKEFADIEGVTNGFAQAVDQNTHNVYIGTNNGIYKYNQNSKTAEFLGAEGVDVWSVYYKDNNVYFSNFPGQFLYTIVDGQIERVKDLEDTKVDHFIIDNEDVFFYSNFTGLYGQKKGTKDAVLYQELTDEGMRGITMDANGKVYVCLRNGIFSVDKSSVSLQKEVDLDDGFGVAFDNENNIVYSDANNVYRLKPNKEKSC